MTQFKIDDRVKVVARHGGVFCTYNFNEEGTVTDITGGETVWVLFDHNGEIDYGLAGDLELVSRTPIAVGIAPVASSVADKLAQIEALITEIKTILG